MNSKILYLSLIGLAVAGPTLAATEIDERRDMSADGTVSVSNVAGEIEIETWDHDEVHVTGELGKGFILDISSSSGNVRIEVKNENDRDDWNSDFTESDLFLLVPVGASITASGVSSDVTVIGSRGEEISAESVSGDVEVEGQVGKLDLSSVSGDVTFTGSASRTSAETVSGDIELEGIDGELEVSLVSGDAYVHAGSLSRGKFESVSGSLELNLGVSSGGRLYVESMSGDVNLLLPAGQEGEIKVQTFSGDIESEFGSTQSESKGPGRSLKYSAGDDTATIRLESFSGDIEIGHK